MSSAAGRKRERSPDDGNPEARGGSRLPFKRVSIDLSEEGEIAEDGTGPAGRSLASKDTDYPVAVKEKSPGEVFVNRPDRISSVPQQSRGSVQVPNSNPQPSATMSSSSRPTLLPEPQPVARGMQTLQPQQSSWKSLLGSNVPLERLSHTLPSLPTKDQASILQPLRRGESVVVYGRHSAGELLTVKLSLLDGYYNGSSRSRAKSREPRPERPSAIYVAPTREKCEALARSLNAFDKEPHIVVFGNYSDMRDSKAPPSLEGSIVCTTPAGLLGCVGQEYIALSHVSVLVLEHVEEMTTGKSCDHVSQIQDLLRKQTIVKPVQLILGAGLTVSQLRGLEACSHRRFSAGPIMIQVGAAAEARVRVPSRPRQEPTEKLQAATSTGLPRQSLVLSYLVTEKDKASKLLQLQYFVERSLSKDRKVLVISPDDNDHSWLGLVLASHPAIRMQKVMLGTNHELHPRYFDMLSSGELNVLLISIDKANSRLVTSHSSRKPLSIDVCIFRLYKEHGGRSWFQKYEQLILRLSAIPQIRECFTMLDTDEAKVGHGNKIMRWLTEIKRGVPPCLQPTRDSR
ncbi:hypothetical protein KC343_g12185 [Hortaea werneckii]|nr:hypothetical protein KC323_g7833 [Hortaea werneckii]KAI7347054.1 hypothetical protein KC320_g7468 [Hortaea werneckii]KAI7559579.1 hypothetical protein KC317_g10272 [Hortaea werneckii]KAI7609788.1 hypothetical protein KC343_g12185 [Hortaea werneckii]KAI7642093.1 hypothetical protein KC319_g13209 [Hortaea werneckii]